MARFECGSGTGSELTGRFGINDVGIVGGILSLEYTGHGYTTASSVSKKMCISFLERQDFSSSFCDKYRMLEMRTT